MVKTVLMFRTNPDGSYCFAGLFHNDGNEGLVRELEREIPPGITVLQLESESSIPSIYSVNRIGEPREDD